MDSNKVLANSYVLQCGGYELAKSRASFDELEAELLGLATDSIKKLDSIGGIPLGFSHQFVATYPDVVLWMNSLPDEKFDKLFDGADEEELLNEDGKLNTKGLRMIIDAYKKTGVALECLAETS